MGPTVAVTGAGASAESLDAGNDGKKKGIRRLLTPAIFSGGNHKKAAAQADAGVAPTAAAAVQPHHRGQTKTVIETAFVNNNRGGGGGGGGVDNLNSCSNDAAGNAAYRLQQQRNHYVRELNRHVNAANDFRSRSVSPGSLDRGDVNANYGDVRPRRADSACSLSSTSSSAAVAPECSVSSGGGGSGSVSSSTTHPSPSGRRSAPIIPYSQYYNNWNSGGGAGRQQQQQQQQGRLLLMPVSAQVKISVPPSSALYATAVRQQSQQHASAIYGNVRTGTTPAADCRVGQFVRGSPQRATIGCVRESSSRLQSTIYETAEEDAPAQATRGGGKRFQPIFKRGALQEPDPRGDSSGETSASASSPKRVSFSPLQRPVAVAATGPSPSEPAAYWPTKRGPSQQPPTRRRSTDTTDRPLPPVPKRSPSTSAIYGSLRTAHQQQQPLHRGWWLSPTPQHHSGSESGSEAGEVQRILYAKNGLHVTGKQRSIP